MSYLNTVEIFNFGAQYSLDRSAVTMVLTTLCVQLPNYRTMQTGVLVTTDYGWSPAQLFLMAHGHWPSNQEKFSCVLGAAMQQRRCMAARPLHGSSVGAWQPPCHAPLSLRRPFQKGMVAPQACSWLRLAVGNLFVHFGSDSVPSGSLMFSRPPF